MSRGGSAHGFGGARVGEEASPVRRSVGYLAGCGWGATLQGSEGRLEKSLVRGDGCAVELVVRGFVLGVTDRGGSRARLHALVDEAVEDPVDGGLRGDLLGEYRC